MECNWIYQSHTRAITLPRKSWQTQNELHLCAHACLCRFMLLVCVWHFLYYYFLACIEGLFVWFILLHFYLFVYFILFLFFLDRKHTERKNMKLGATKEWRYSKKKFMSPIFPLLSIETTDSNILEFFLESHAQGKKILNPAAIQKGNMSLRRNFSEFWKLAEDLTRETGAQTIMMGRTTPRPRTN